MDSHSDRTLLLFYFWNNRLGKIERYGTFRDDFPHLPPTMHETVEQTLRKECEHYCAADRALLHRAIALGYEGHEGQIRKASQSPYIIHPLEVSLELHRRFGLPSLTIAGLLHDVVEDSVCIDIDQIYHEFGEDIGFLVDAVTKTHLHFYRTHQHFDTYMDKLLFGGLHDVRVFILKLADRDNNMETLPLLKGEKQVRISFETQAIFSPLRELLGYDRSGVSVDDIANNFMEFVDNNGLVTPFSLQQHLLHTTFQEFNRETFRQVYSFSDKIVWEIHDMDKYAQLCHNENFEKTVQVLSLSTDGTNFRVTFRFKGAHIIDQKELAKFALSSFSAQQQQV